MIRRDSRSLYSSVENKKKRKGGQKVFVNKFVQSHVNRNSDSNKHFYSCSISLPPYRSQESIQDFFFIVSNYFLGFTLLGSRSSISWLIALFIDFSLTAMACGNNEEVTVKHHRSGCVIFFVF